jgi:hypothetical protein
MGCSGRAFKWHTIFEGQQMIITFTLIGALLVLSVVLMFAV